MDREIKFEKWKDPFAKALKAMQEKDEADWNISRNGFLDTSAEEAETHGQTGPSIVGPMGVIPLHESNLPSKIYNFWMGHTNFDITHEIAHQISLVEGVESLDIFTRYRFRLGIGKIFAEDEVKKAIKREICTNESKQPLNFSANKLDFIQQELTRKFKFWAIGKREDGSVQVAGGESEEEVQNKVAAFNGILQEMVYSWR